MKWLALFLVCIQAKRISACVFDKVEEMTADIYGHVCDTTREDVNQCLAKCYEDKSCMMILHEKVGNSCQLICEDEQPMTFTCTDEAVCYILHRDEVDSGCQRYLHF